ncbi:hypothetical protein [Erwinia amylovora]|uniref:hypothetical protein n=1 Tax=Erwinia amylovora TaxID=552 RepID=UPI0014445F4F|nr:hypothetical protein [Erwinia amylovora]
MPSNISLSDLSPRAQSVLTFPETRAKPGNCPNCGQSLLEDISSVTNSSGRLGDPDFGIPKAIKNAASSLDKSTSDSSASESESEHYYCAVRTECSGENSIANAEFNDQGTEPDGVSSLQVVRDHIISQLNSLMEQIKKEPGIMSLMAICLIMWICETIYEYGKQSGHCSMDLYQAHGFSYPPHRLHGVLREHVSVPELAARVPESSISQISSKHHYYTDNRLENVNYSPRN